MATCQYIYDFMREVGNAARRFPPTRGIGSADSARLIAVCSANAPAQRQLGITGGALLLSVVRHSTFAGNRLLPTTIGNSADHHYCTDVNYRAIPDYGRSNKRTIYILKAQLVLK